MQIPTPRHLRSLRADCLESSFVEKNPRLLVHKMTISQQSTLVAKNDEQHCQEVNGGNPSPLHSTGEATPGLLYAVLGSSVHAKLSPAKVHKDN